MSKKSSNNRPPLRDLPQKRPDFTVKKFITSPDFLANALMLVLGFVLLFVSYKFVQQQTVQLILTFLGIGMTFSSTDQMMELYNEKCYGIKSNKRKTIFGSRNGEDQKKE